MSLEYMQFSLTEITNKNIKIYTNMCVDFIKIAYFNDC